MKKGGSYMEITIHEYREKDVPEIREIWNEIVKSALAFPEEELLGEDEASEFFKNQTATICAYEGEVVVGFYILHPNGYGRRSHICNTSYGVKANCRGKGIGRKLVLDSFTRCKKYGFKVLQYNGVVSVNEPALNLYRSLGMIEAGRVENGYRLKDGTYCDGVMFTKQL